MTTLEYVNNYAGLKLQSRQWQPGQLIPSENILASRFSTSRATIRRALAPFVHMGMLRPVRGKGYFVNDLPSDNAFTSLSKKLNITKTRTKIIEPTAEMEKLLEIEDSEMANFIKKDYFIGEKLISTMITALNKKCILNVNLKGLNQSIVGEVTRNGIVIKNGFVEAMFIKSDIFDEEAESIGWSKTEPLLVEFVSNSNSWTWVEKSIRITNKDYFKVNVFKNNTIV